MKDRSLRELLDELDEEEKGHQNEEQTRIFLESTSVLEFLEELEETEKGLR